MKKFLMLIGSTIATLALDVGANDASSPHNSAEGTSIQMDDLSELSAYPGMVKQNRKLDAVLSSVVQFGMSCDDLSLDGWRCRDSDGETYERFVDASGEFDYRLNPPEDLDTFVWSSKGHLLGFFPSSYLDVSKYDLAPYTSLKYLSLYEEDVDKLLNVPESVKFVDLRARSEVKYDLLKRTPNLKVLHLDTFNLKGTVDIDNFPLLKDLEYLYIREGGKVRNFEALSDRFPNLKGFAATGLEVSGEAIEVFAEYPNLERLKLYPSESGAPWKGSEHFLSELPNLRRLSIYGFGDIDPALFKHNPKLERLSFYSSKPSLEDLPYLPNLVFLSPNRVESLEGIERFKSLEALNLDYQTVDLRPLERLPNLYWLNLANGGYRNLNELKNVDGLRYLNIEETPVENIDAVSDFRCLEELYLAGFDPDNQNLERLPDMSMLDELRTVSVRSVPIKEIGKLPDSDELEKVSVTIPGKRLGDTSVPHIRVVDFNPSPQLVDFYCDRCMDHEVNKEVTPKILASTRKTFREKKALEEKELRDRQLLYLSLKARWEEGEGD